MADISEALERLAGLRDRGVLTPEEFERQKNVLLDPPAPTAPAAYAAPPSYAGGNDKTPLYVVGGIALLVVIGAILWATGVIGRSGSTPLVASNTAPLGTASLGGSAPSAPLGGSTSADASGNPLLGEWLPDTPGGECPAHLTVGPTQIVAAMPNGRSEVVNVSFAVLGGGAVQMTNMDRPGATSQRVTVRDGRMNLEECGFHRG